MRVFLFLVCNLVAFSCYGQNQQLLYNFNNQPQALMSNPGAAITFDKHIGIPLLSGFSIHAGSSGISAFDIFEADSDINSNINTAVNTLTDRDFFTAHQELEMISFGWRSIDSDIYYSGGMYQELDAYIYYPRDLALLAYRGNADYIGIPFDFSDVSFTTDLLTVYHFGANKKVSEKWQVGARVKLYSSIANVNSTSNRGDFITQVTPDGPNFYSHSVRNADLVANTSGLGFLFDDEEDFNAGDLAKRALLSSSLGFGIDVGVTYTVNEHWTATGSVIDLGAITHAKNVNNYSVTGGFSTDGIELEFPALLVGEETTEYFEEFKEVTIDNIEIADSLQNNYATWRSTRFNGSLQYGFGTAMDAGDSCNCQGGGGGSNWTNNVGIQLFAIKRPKGLQRAITAYYDRRWTSFLQTKLTYTYDAFSAKNIGALVSTKIYNFNLYLAADNLLELPNMAKAQSVSLQLGMQLVFDPK